MVEKKAEKKADLLVGWKAEMVSMTVVK